MRSVNSRMAWSMFTTSIDITYPKGSNARPRKLWNACRSQSEKVGSTLGQEYQQNPERWQHQIELSYCWQDVYGYRFQSTRTRKKNAQCTSFLVEEVTYSFALAKIIRFHLFCAVVAMHARASGMMRLPEPLIHRYFVADCFANAELPHFSRPYYYRTLNEHVT